MYVNLSMRSQGVGAVGHQKSDSLKKSTSVEKLGGGGGGGLHITFSKLKLAKLD